MHSFGTTCSPWNSSYLIFCHLISLVGALLMLVLSIGDNSPVYVSPDLSFLIYTLILQRKKKSVFTKEKILVKYWALVPEIQNLGMSTKEIRQWSRHSLKMHLELTKYTHSISWIFFYKINNAKIYVFVIQWKELGRKSVVEGIYCMLWNQMQIINHLCRVIELQLFPLESLEAPCYGDWQFNLLSQPRICCSVWLGQLYNLSVPMSSPKKGHNDTTNITGMLC